MLTISSTRNPHIHRLTKLREKAHERKKEGLFVIEGLRELMLALKSSYTLREVFFCRPMVNEKAIAQIKIIAPEAEWIEVSEYIYRKIAVRNTTEGIMSVAETRTHKIGDITLPENPLLLVTESLEKPGNLGALLRTADAVGLDAMIICDTKVDLYNPNVVRSSLGCLFTRQIAICNSGEAVEWLRKRNIKIHTAMPDGAENYLKADYSGPSAIVVGSEATGLSRTWQENADNRIFIPMKGVADSLNVSVSAAAILFEALRQRR